MNQQWAGAMKCLVMNEPFNYSYLIYSYMLGNIQGDTFMMYPCFIQMILNAKLKNLPTTGCQLKLTHMGKTIVVDMRESKEENIEGDVPQQHEQQGEGLQGGNVGGVEERIELPEITKEERKVLNERRKKRKHERRAPSGI
ncbi:hypothetical protein L1987_23996 [Smallanthus sonchifolius]|uniref:Uncharacterized protein n=1 Tax=Smallanthus sonchifolius TaxID=185202 RepID=A0ACB9IKY4_9ASTR|nr:hypothetical protein L1987_23996 [Smallanthus sonchifolius]